MANQKAESQAKEISELFVGNDEAKELARAMAREAIEKMKAEVRANPAARACARARLSPGERHPAEPPPRASAAHAHRNPTRKNSRARLARSPHLALVAVHRHEGGDGPQIQLANGGEQAPAI